MWNLTPDHMCMIPRDKSDNVVFTLTAHRPDRVSDQALIVLLKQYYKTVYFFPQGDKDLAYLKSLGNSSESLILVDRKLSAFTELLINGKVDYVGTRLHGGLHALNLKVRTFIISVDNRAAEISRDTNLPCFTRHPDWNILKEAIHASYNISLTIDWNAIERWKQEVKNNVCKQDL